MAFCAPFGVARLRSAQKRFSQRTLFALLQPPNLPNRCACGQDFSVNHALTCPTGGFLSLWHNEIRDLTAGLLREVCHDVQRSCTYSRSLARPLLDEQRTQHRRLVLMFPPLDCGEITSAVHFLMFRFFTPSCRHSDLPACLLSLTDSNRKNNDSISRGCSKLKCLLLRHWCLVRLEAWGGQQKPLSKG